MIRDARAFVAINTVGALIALYLVVFWGAWRPVRSIFLVRLYVVLAAVMFAGFIYQIVKRSSGRAMHFAPWTHNMTDRRLWTIKFS